ncbi:MAG: hypothetical protein K6G29_13795 [Clostridiales bacterium]|nr:hypothetical protein [Clostridiales bacterium]
MKFLKAVFSRVTFMALIVVLEAALHDGERRGLTIRADGDILYSID